ncbi:MAG: class I SAM-dependent methyltransferase [Actinomycetota bacterium]
MDHSPTDFFDGVYARAGGDDTAVPWQHAVSRRFIDPWLQRYRPKDDHRRALVVAAGLGDDAAALAARGMAVTAFDAAPTAVDWARTRHPDAAVDWHVADLFALPPDWSEAFDLVVEVFTIQSIEPARQPAAADAIRHLVAPGGALVAVALHHDGERTPDGPPWPLHPSTLDGLTAGMTERAQRSEPVADGVSCVLVEVERGI